MKRRSATSSDRDQSTMNRTKARFKLTILSGEDGLEDGNCKSMQSAHVTRRVCFKRAQAYLSEKHLSEDASDRPDVDRMVVLLPREHDLGRSVVPGRDVTGHLRVCRGKQPNRHDVSSTVRQDSCRPQMKRGER